MFFAVINQLAIEQELAAYLAEPANEFITLEILSVCVGHNLAVNSPLKSRQLREQSLTLGLKLGHCLMI